MKTKRWAVNLILAFFALWTLSATAAENEQAFPSEMATSSGKTIQLKTPKGMVSIQLPSNSPEYANLPVAEVNGEPILLEELSSELMAMHADVSEQEHAGQDNISTILQRLINLRLLEIEARNIGFNETPDFAKEAKAFKGQLLRTMLRSQQVKEVQPDEKEVAKLYKEMSTFVKLESVMFTKKKDAKKARKEIKDGASYEDIVRKALQEGIAQGSLLGPSTYSQDQLMPQVVEFVSKAKPGDLSPVISTGDGYALIRVAEGIKKVDDPQIMDKARQKLLAQKNLEVLRAYFEGLKQKYAVVHQDIIDGIDYTAEKPGLDALMKDKRVIIEIKDETPITVADFTAEMEKKLYHGSDSQKNLHRLNEMKKTTEENILFKQLFLKEALRLGLDKTEQYEKGIQSFERKFLFNAFVNQVIVPEAKVKEEMVRKEYDENLSEYSTPKMFRIKSLIFDNAVSAKDAHKLLRKGTDYKWMSANAEHQVKKDAEGVMEFEGNILSLSALPQDVQEVVADGQEGDYRLYESPAGHFYVLAIEKVYPATPTPYEKVRQSIAQDLFKKRIPEKIEEWSAKLRKAYEVKVYLADTHE